MGAEAAAPLEANPQSFFTASAPTNFGNHASPSGDLGLEELLSEPFKSPITNTPQAPSNPFNPKVYEAIIEELVWLETSNIFISYSDEVLSTAGSKCNRVGDCWQCFSHAKCVAIQFNHPSSRLAVFDRECIVQLASVEWKYKKMAVCQGKTDEETNLKRRSLLFCQIATPGCSSIWEHNYF